MQDSILTLDGISKAYKNESGVLPILERVSLDLKEGSIVAITGQSGSGKSTLLSVAALLTEKDGGKILYKGKDTDKMSKSEITDLRRNGMGFVFQSSLLLEDFSALENIAMPLMIHGMKKSDAMERAKGFLDLVGLSSRATHRPARLSGGERQRIAIARALAPEPYIIFADEPTGSLDEKSAFEVEALLMEAVKNNGNGMLLVTHNLELASRCDEVYTLTGGCLVK